MATNPRKNEHHDVCRCDECVVEKVPNRALADQIVYRLALNCVIQDSGEAEQRALECVCRAMLEMTPHGD